MWSETLANVMILVALLGLPVSTRIVKHRLYDIDLVINRTIVYGSLTVVLALLYFGGVTAPSEDVSLRWSWWSLISPNRADGLTGSTQFR